jgi:PAS domain S-box-containing protein
MPALRRRAEAMLGKMIEKVVPSLAPENVEALARELRVHQIELQMQCEELRRAGQAADEDRERYYQLYETAPGAYISLDPQLRIEQINRAGERLLGLERTALVGKRLAAFLGEEGGLEFLRACRQAFSSGEQIACETSVQSGGRLRTVLIEICPLGSHEDNRHLRLAAIDITERKQAEDRLKEQREALGRSEKELQALSTRLLSMEQEVRQHVARDLQDEFSQRITTLIWELSALEQRSDLAPDFMAKLHEVKQRISHMGVDLHHLGQRLHSGFLEHCELHVAMKEYIDELNMFATPQIAFEAAMTGSGCRADQSVALFRIMQEALVNAAKHAGAGAVTVALARTASELVLTIRDTGKGFDQDAHDKAPAGFGRIIMRERMRAIGGRFTIESHPGQGTTVTAALSVPGAA